ncbi:MAG: radical SAM protein, partial [Candidatus Riflebacteria bacterium]|nr:radical SAM protein [Candidatus Riflebacteria bacterium]
TLNLTNTRKEYVSTKEIKYELDDWFEKDGQADYITMAGSGEPTLHTDIGEIISHIKAKSCIPVAVLTNGYLLQNNEVRKSLLKADTVKISLSAWDNSSLQLINRPYDTNFDALVEGEVSFAKEYKGTLWLEVFLMDGINSDPEQVKQIAKYAQQISPNKIQLNTSVRPTAEACAKKVSYEKLKTLSEIFTPNAEIIADFIISETPKFIADENAIYEMLLRRPCTLKQISDVFGMHLNEVAKYTGKLQKDGKIKTIRQYDETYYSASKDF